MDNQKIDQIQAQENQDKDKDKRTNPDTNELLSGGEPNFAAGSVLSPSEVVEDATTAQPGTNRPGQVTQPAMPQPSLVDPDAPVKREKLDAVPTDASQAGTHTSDAEYQALHNDSSSPNYKDEAYRHKNQPTTGPNTGDHPDTTPKENVAY